MNIQCRIITSVINIKFLNMIHGKFYWSSFQMENTSFDAPKSVSPRTEDTELCEVKIVVPTASVATATPTTSPPLPEGIPCGNGGCKTSRSRGDPRPESPWHSLKTIFLMSVIIALIIWVIVYTLLTKYQILWINFILQEMHKYWFTYNVSRLSYCRFYTDTVQIDAAAALFVLQYPKCRMNHWLLCFNVEIKKTLSLINCN